MARDGKTVAKSFRINQAALEALQEEARKQTISLNTLVNQLLVSYSEFGRYMKHVHSVMLTRQTFAEILNAAPEDKLIEAAKKAGKSAPETIVESMYGKVTLNGLLEYLHYLSGYANLFEYSEKEENGHWTITMTHELGPKWSLFIGNYFSQSLESAGVKSKYKISDRSTTFNI